MNPYVNVPTAVFAMKLSPTALMLYCFLGAWSENEKAPTIRQMASLLSLNKDTVVRGIGELEDKKLIVKYTRGTHSEYIWLGDAEND